MVRTHGWRAVLPAALLFLFVTSEGPSAQRPIGADQWKRGKANEVQPRGRTPVRVAQEEQEPPLPPPPPPVVVEGEDIVDEPAVTPPPRPPIVVEGDTEEEDLPIDDDPADMEVPPFEIETEVRDFSAFDVDEIQLQELRALGEQIEAQLTTQTVELSLMDCVHLALLNNQDILIINYEPQQAFGDLVAARGEFDPLLSGQFNWTDVLQSANPQTVAFGGITSIENYTTNAQLQLSGFLEWGTQYSVTAAIEYEEGTFSQFIGQYNSRVTLSLTQPLLRGFGRGANLARIRTANNVVAINQAQVMIQVLDVVGQVINAYWDLVAAKRNLVIRQEALANAERIVDINQKRLDIGMAAPIEVIQARAGVAPRITDLVTARKAIADASDILKLLLNMRDGDYLSRVQIEPVDSPTEFEFDWEEQESMKLALEYRPEIQAQELTIDNAVIERRRSRTDLLPQLDVRYDVTYGGRDTRLEETFNGIRRKQDEIMQWIIQGSIPIGNRVARGQYHRAKLEVRQEEERLEQVKTQLMYNVRSAGLDVIANKLIIESSELNVELQETNVEAEVQKLELGTSTNQQVLEIQEDLTQAEVDLLVSQVNAQKALADLRLAEGTLLEEFGIKYELPEVEKPLNSVQSFQDRENTWRKQKYREMGLVEE